MDEFKRLMGFVMEEKPRILITPCAKLDELKNELQGYDFTCADVECKEREKCIKININVPFLPLNRFDVWIVDLEHAFPLNLGYIFYLAKNTLKDNGVLTIIGKQVDDSIALSYGLKILYHGEWHYYLKG